MALFPSILFLLDTNCSFITNWFACSAWYIIILGNFLYTYLEDRLFGCFAAFQRTINRFGAYGFLSLPKVANSLKTIYQVLKFAAKHKAPLSRSALTYWEEDIPSRMDLGKSRYAWWSIHYRTRAS